MGVRSSSTTSWSTRPDAGGSSQPRSAVLVADRALPDARGANRARWFPQRAGCGAAYALLVVGGMSTNSNGRLRGRLRRYALAGLALACVFVGCAAGDARFTAGSPAGFWVGLWHGIISLATLVIGLFDDHVRVYEVDNTGRLYDFGFWLGVVCMAGGGSRSVRPARPKTRNEKEWEEIGAKVEKKLRRKIREWAEAEPSEDWKVVGEMAEAKLKAKVREWAEEEDSPIAKG